MSQGYGRIHFKVMSDTRLSVGAKALYGLLCAMGGKKGECFPGKQYLCNALGVSKETIKRYVRELKDYAYIDVEARKSERESSKNMNQSNLYKVVLVQAENAELGQKQGRWGHTRPHVGSPVTPIIITNNNKNIAKQALNRGKVTPIDIRRQVDNVNKMIDKLGMKHNASATGFIEAAITNVGYDAIISALVNLSKGYKVDGQSHSAEELLKCEEDGKLIRSYCALHKRMA